MFEQYQHAHFVGIGGIGMSALAKWFLREGVGVSGSDVRLSKITHDLEIRGATIFSGHAPTNLSEDVDLLIYSPAVPKINVELVAANNRGILAQTNFEFLGELSKQFKTIVVAGTNGKSTTTAMLGRILEQASLDPTVLVGSLVPGFKDGNLRLGDSDLFVVEGCEYRANMTYFDPYMVVLTNIEEDHLDFYRDLEHIKETFQSFIDKAKYAVVANSDDKTSNELTFSRLVSYGTSGTYKLEGREHESGLQRAQTSVGELELRVPGEFNVYNALAATAAAMELGVSFKDCQRSLKSFKGIWRRFELVGTWKGVRIISDYGHHPTSIKATIEATREFFPNHRVVLCYQPHQYDRAKKLFDEFVGALSLADVTIVAEIYDVAGRDEGHEVSSKDLVEAIGKEQVTFAPDFAAAESRLRDVVKQGDIVLIMGAGDIDELARKLV